MVKYLDVKGKHVRDENGNLIGTVENSIIDTANMKITSLVVISKTLLTKYYLLPLKSITCYGETIDFKKDIYKTVKIVLNKNKSFVLQNYIGREIIDTNGKKAGKLIDIIFDERNGSMKALISSCGFFEDIFEGRKVIMVNDKTAFGKEKIIVDACGIEICNDVFFKKFLKG